MLRRGDAEFATVLSGAPPAGRNLAFIATLMESGVEFLAVDNPHANNGDQARPAGHEA
jgi:hypothetical protein